MERGNIGNTKNMDQIKSTEFFSCVLNYTRLIEKTKTVFQGHETSNATFGDLSVLLIRDGEQMVSKLKDAIAAGGNIKMIGEVVRALNGNIPYHKGWHNIEHRNGKVVVTNAVGNEVSTAEMIKGQILESRMRATVAQLKEIINDARENASIANIPLEHQVTIENCNGKDVILDKRDLAIRTPSPTLTNPSIEDIIPSTNKEQSEEIISEIMRGKRGKGACIAIRALIKSKVIRIEQFPRRAVYGAISDFIGANIGSDASINKYWADDTVEGEIAKICKQIEKIIKQ